MATVTVTAIACGFAHVAAVGVTKRGRPGNPGDDNTGGGGGGGGENTGTSALDVIDGGGGGFDGEAEPSAPPRGFLFTWGDNSRGQLGRKDKEVRL